MAIKDRIKELRRVKASDIIPNPKNWRTHPPAQQQAIAGILAEVGYADALIAYEGSQGLTLIDGHLRAETTPDDEVPVLILDVNDEEADKILATLDPVSVMAGADEFLLEGLIDSITSEDSRLSSFLTQIRDGLEPGFEPLGAWDPDLDQFERIDPTDSGIEARIIVRCPQAAAKKITDLIEQAILDHPEASID